MMVVSKLSKNNTIKKNINYEKILKELKILKNVKNVKNLKSKKFSKLMKGGENGNNNMTTELLHDKQIGYEGTKPEQENVGKRWWQYSKNPFNLCLNNEEGSRLCFITTILTLISNNFFGYIIIYFISKFVFTNNCERYKLRDKIFVPFLLFWALNTICIFFYYEFKIMTDIDDEKDPVHWLKYAGLDKDHMPFDFMKNQHNAGMSVLRLVLFYPFQSLYYSIVTLSTIGFGDIYPIGVIPRLIFLLFVIKVVIGIFSLDITKNIDCEPLQEIKQQYISGSKAKLQRATKKLQAANRLSSNPQTNRQSTSGTV